MARDILATRIEQPRSLRCRHEHASTSGVAACDRTAESLRVLKGSSARPSRVTAHGGGVEAHVTVEKISAVALKVASMPTSVRFYRDLLGLEMIYGGEDVYFSSLRTKHGKDPILSLEWGNPVA